MMSRSDTEKSTHYCYFELLDKKFDKEFNKRFDCPLFSHLCIFPARQSLTLTIQAYACITLGQAVRDNLRCKTDISINSVHFVDFCTHMNNKCRFTRHYQ